MNISRFFLILAALAVIPACRPAVPSKTSKDFQPAVRSFYIGLSAMEVSDDARAKTELTKTTSLAPGEPAAWANLGILAMRQKDLEAAATALDKARELAPDNGQVLRNLYILETQRGDFDTAIAYLKKAITIDQNDLKAQYALAREYERQTNDTEAIAAYEQVARLRPNNLAAKLEVARLAAKQADVEKLKQIFAQIEPRNSAWDAEIQKQFQTLETSAASGNVREVSQNVAFFRNVLLRLPEFRSEIAEVRFDDTIAGEPFSKPLKLPVPDASPAPADEGLTFTPQPVANEKARWCKAVYLDGDSAPVIAWATDSEVHVGDRTLPVALSNDLETIDIDYNYKNDLIVTGDKGVRFFDDSFQEITAKTTIPPALLNRKYLKAFVFDIEADGDLDLVLAAETGPPVVLQNNSDGRFQEIKLFSEVNGLRDVATGDLDEDGDVDVAMVDEVGDLRIYSNERGGQFSGRKMPDSKDTYDTSPDSNGVLKNSTRTVSISRRVVSVAFGDSNADGKLDLHVLRLDGRLVRVTDKDGGTGWTDPEVILTLTSHKPYVVISDANLIMAGLSSFPPLVIQDFDNNGSIDISVIGQVWLNGTGGFLEAKNHQILLSNGNSGDLNADGLVDLVGLDDDGKPCIFINSGTKNYGWQVIRPRSAKADGDQRINSFGIGGEIEIRSGLLPQKRIITSPQVHFGLGEQTGVDVMRIVWQNGYVQADFDLQPNQQVLAEQRLKGSCPHLFTWDGTGFAMVKDAPPWSPALGLKINAQDTFGVLATEEWFKIPGDKLVPRDGSYELRITGEYWEAYYIDNYSLLAVDHPADTEVFTDERFSIPLPPLKVFTTEPIRPFSSVKNDKGDDVSQTVKSIDERYLDGFPLGSFQGVATDHFAEMELPEDAPRDRKLWLIADGWVHPTDASINVELGQSSKPKPKSLSLEALGSDGTWKTVKDNLGFPAGKMKTVLIDLPAGPRRFRLRTNMEVFWDRLAWGADIADAKNTETHLQLTAAEVRHRGFSLMEKRDASSPEKPDYSHIVTTTQKWRDLEGYYTRYGDVLDLLSNVDDRYTITGAGDEIVLRFPALPDVQAGWRRDFVIIGNGWIKDGDLNTVFSHTVLPLPTHASNDYSHPPGRLEDDPVYRQHSADWLNFHTRYVAPDQFRNALRNK